MIFDVVQMHILGVSVNTLVAETTKSRILTCDQDIQVSCILQLTSSEHDVLLILIVFMWTARGYLSCELWRRSPFR
jgi:hypothetical protein